MNQSKTVTGKINPAGIQKADRFFNGDFRTTMVELLQNARRAGATVMDITVSLVEEDRVAICVEDNGKGVEDPAVLFTLMESGWEDETQVNEDPAGAGFFSLCSLTDQIAIGSRDWKLIATRAVFLGKESATVLKATNPIQGLRISFTCKTASYSPVRTQEAAPIWVKGQVEKDVQFGSVDVRVNGVSIPRFDFLSQCFAIKEMYGVRVGICDGKKAPGSNHAVHPFNSAGSHRVNFHGLLIRSANLATLAGLGADGHSDFTVMIDIKNTTEIKLVLPQRNDMVENDAFKLLVAASRKFLYESALAHVGGLHRLPFAVYKAARDMGIALPEAVARLRHLRVRAYDSNSDQLRYPDDQYDPIEVSDIRADGLCALVDIENKAARLSLLVAAACNQNDGQYDPNGIASFSPGVDDAVLLLAAVEKFKGYSWYDKLPVIDELQLELTAVDGQIQIWNQDAERLAPEGDPFTIHHSTQEALSDAFVHVQIASIDPVKTKAFKWRVPVIFIPDYNDSADDVVNVAWAHSVDALGSSKVKSELVDMLMLLGFSPSDESDYDEQYDAEHTAARDITTRALFGDEEAFVSLVTRFLLGDHETDLKIAAGRLNAEKLIIEIDIPKLDPKKLYEGRIGAAFRLIYRKVGRKQKPEMTRTLRAKQDAIE